MWSRKSEKCALSESVHYLRLFFPRQDAHKTFCSILCQVLSPWRYRACSSVGYSISFDEQVKIIMKTPQSLCATLFLLFLTYAVHDFEPHLYGIRSVLQHCCVTRNRVSYAGLTQGRAIVYFFLIFFSIGSGLLDPSSLHGVE